MAFMRHMCIKLYNLGIVRFFRSEFQRKLNNFIAPVSEKMAELSVQQQKITEMATSLHQIERQIAENQFISQVNLLNEANIKHDEQLFLLRHIFQEQGYVAYFSCWGELLKQFLTVIQKVMGQDYPALQAQAEMIFLEIFIGHFRPGGLWQLKKDLKSFEDGPKEPPQKVAQPVAPPSGHEGRKLKVLIVSGCFPSFMHGGGGRLFDIIYEMSNRYSIDLYTHFNQIHDQESLDVLRERVEHIKLVDFPDLTVNAIGAWIRSIHGGRGYYDIVQLEYPQTVRLINQLRPYGAKVGFTFMECQAKSYTDKLTEVLASEEFETASRLSRMTWQALADEKFALDNADFCIAVTPEDADFLGRLSPRRPSIVPTCISEFAILREMDTYQDTVQEPNTACFVGFFDHWPNLEAMEWYLNEIHPLVKQRVPGYKLYIVGCGDVIKLVRMSEGDPSVAVIGRVDSVVPCILRSRICISPLISGAGIRGKQNQYSVLGRPSVTTPLGNKGLVYQHGVSVMIAEQATDFAEAMVKLFTDHALYTSMQQEARQIALAHYTWKAQFQEIDTIYTH